MTDYIKHNRDTWNKKTPVHLSSAFYDMDSFLHGRNSLTSVELELLGEVKGLSILHLQCHFGQDSLSLARMGAKVTGLDLSDAAIEKARELNVQLGLNAKFVCADVYSAPEVIDEKFDIVYTSFGTIAWLPDLDRWAEVIASSMKPGGRFVFVEFHPFVWTFDDDLQHIAYDYFKSEPIVEEIEGTYADRNAPIKTKTISWNHSLSEVFEALLKTGMRVEHFREYDFSPHNCFKGMREESPGHFKFAHLDHTIPMVYSMLMVK